jgi:tetratricopeptide (TPR) repeat protein
VCRRRFRIAERLEERAEADEDLQPISWLFTFPALSQADSLPPHIERDARAFYLRRIERAERKGGKDAATAHYNLARHFMNVHRGRDAFRHFRRAARFDPSYLRKDYFCHEMAGCLFEAGFYRISAAYYRQAIENGASGLTLALHGDALMAAGEYAAAIRAFGDYEHQGDAKAEFRLKRWSLIQLSDFTGESGRRHRERADEKVAAALTRQTTQEVVNGLWEALEEDSLCGTAWFNLGVAAWENNDIENAFGHFLLAALMLRHDVEPWRNVVLIAWQGMGQEEFAPDLGASDLFDAAWNLNGHSIVPALIAALDEQATIDKAAFLDWLEERQGAQPLNDPGFEVRFPGRGSRYHSFRIEPPDDA